MDIKQSTSNKIRLPSGETWEGKKGPQKYTTDATPSTFLKNSPSDLKEDGAQRNFLR